MVTQGSAPQSYSNSWPTEYIPHLVQGISDSQFGWKSVLCHLPRQDGKMALLLPAAAIISLYLSLLSLYNGLLPSPRPLQLVALPSFSSSDFLRQAVADRTVQARGQLGKRGRDSWTCCQLHWLTRNHTHTHGASLMGSQCTSKLTCGPTVCRLKWTFRNREIKKVLVLFIYLHRKKLQ